MELDKVKTLLFFLFLGWLTCSHAQSLGGIPKEAHKSEGSEDSGPAVSLSINEGYAVMDNGIVQVTLAIPGGHVAGVQFGGIENVLDTTHKESSRGYWDVGWSTEYNSNQMDWLSMQQFSVIRQDENQVELSFATQWSGDPSAIPVNMDKRFVMLRGSSGFYNYLILDREEGWPAANISQIRVAYRVHTDKFHYMAVSDDIQKIMPTQQDIESGHPLAYREAVQWTNTSDPMMRKEVEDKYQYSEDMKDQKVHGWISSGSPSVGFWLIKPSTEFYSAGPFKQELTSHLGPVSLIDFFAGHYAGSTLQITLQDGEPWRKVVGPYFVYLNKASAGEDPYKQLWSMAKDQAQQETGKWPYGFPSSEVYAKANQRGSVGGRLLIRDRYANKNLTPASSAWVGLAAPGEAGSWQTETKGYQFWAQADNDGNFAIKGVHQGEYGLYAWVPGFVGDYKYSLNIIVQSGNQTDLAEIVYEPPRNGPTLWEIGIPDRTAAEFFVPDPRTDLINPVFLNSETNKFRQYGLWDQYTVFYPEQDLVYTIGSSDYRKDWFYAHVPRRTDDTEFQPATWQIRFNLQDVVSYGRYTLRLALASATTSQLRVQFNNFISRSSPQFTTGRIGLDNSIARHGIHGLYWLFSFDVPGFVLQNGMNTLYLTQTIAENVFCGVMYDYIRLEGPTSIMSRTRDRLSLLHEASFEVMNGIIYVTIYLIVLTR